MSESNVDRILAYLREHAGAYAPADLRSQLLAAGYPAADVDAAFARLDAERAAGPRPPAVDATVALPPVEVPPMPAGREPAVDATIALPAADAPPGAAQPGGPADAADDQIRRAQEYIERNRGTYDDAALMATLVQTGYPAEVVAEAMRRLGGPRPTGPARPLAWPIGLLVAGFNLVVAIVAMFVELAILETLWVTLGLVVLLLAAELAGGLALRRGPRERLGRALLLGVGFTFGGAAFGVASIILLIGVCIALYAAG